MFIPMRDLHFFGMIVNPASVLLVVSGIIYCVLRHWINRMVDLNRYVWQRPLTDIALWVILYSLAILTMRPI